MMFPVILGLRKIILTIGTGIFQCPTCNSVQKFRHRQAKGFFILFFIPLLPINTLGSDVQCERCKTIFKPDILEVPQQVTKYENQHPLIQGYAIALCVILMIVIVSTIVPVIIQNSPQQKASLSATALAVANATFGSTYLNRCHQRVSLRFDNWSIRVGSYLLAVNADKQQIAIDYQEQIPQNLRATSKGNLTHIACLYFTAVYYNTEYYGYDGPPGQSPVIPYKCDQFKHVVEIFIVNIPTGEIVARKKFEGAPAPDCPYMTNHDLEVYGPDVVPGDTLSTLQINVPAS